MLSLPTGCYPADSHTQSHGGSEMQAMCCSEYHSKYVVLGQGELVQHFLNVCCDLRMVVRFCAHAWRRVFSMTFAIYARIFSCSLRARCRVARPEFRCSGDWGQNYVPWEQPTPCCQSPISCYRAAFHRRTRPRCCTASSTTGAQVGGCTQIFARRLTCVRG